MPAQPLDYDAFLSYSHAGDGELAPAVQFGLHRFAKPIFALRAVRVFRDRTDLSVSPGLWAGVVAALDRSRCFILLASPTAARSKWVEREIEHWCTIRQNNPILLVLTEGEIHWDAARRNFDFEKSSALPPALSGKFTEEPLWVDLRWARTATDVSLSNPRFREAIADISATLQGRPKAELIGQDIREHAKASRLRWAAVVGLIMLSLVSSAMAWIAFSQRNLARSRQLAAESGMLLDRQPDLSILLAVESSRIEHTTEAQDALLRALSRSPRVQRWIYLQSKPTSVAVRSDSNLVAIGADDGSILLKGYRSPTAVVGPLPAWAFRYSKPPAAISGLALARDGEHVFTVDVTGNLVVHTVGGGSSAPLTLARHGFGLTLSSDGAMLAVSTGDEDTQSTSIKYRVILIDVQGAAPRIVSELEDIPGPVRSVAYSPDGTLLAAGAGDRVMVWRLGSKGAAIAIDVGNHRIVRTLAFSPDSLSIVFATEDGALGDIDVSSRLVRRVRTIHKSAINSIAFVEPSGLVASASDDGTVLLSSLEGKEEPIVIVGDGHEMIAVAALGRDRLLAVGRNALIIDAAPAHGAAVAPVQAVTDGSVRAFAFSPTDDVLAVGVGDLRHPESGTHPILLLDPRSLASTAEPLVGHQGMINALAFDRDGRVLASTARDGRSIRWDLKRHQPIDTMQTDEGLAVSIVGNDLLVVTSRALHSSAGWEFREWSEFDKLEHVSISPHRLAIAGTHSFTDVDPAANPMQWYTTGGTDPLSAVAVSLDGKLIATGDRSGVVQIWSPSNRSVVARMNVHHKDVQRIAIGPNGLLASTDLHELRLISTRTYQFIGDAIRAPANDAIESLAFSPTGAFLAVGTRGGTIAVYDLTLATWQDRACRVVARWLTEDEQLQYLGQRQYSSLCTSLDSASTY